MGCSYLIGNYISQSYTKRYEQVKELVKVLETIKSDLCFGLYTLEEIFYRNTCNDDKIDEFFKNISKELDLHSEIGLKTILENNKNILTEKTYLKEKEVDELIQLIMTLGKSDIDSQVRMIDLSITNLSQITKESKEEISKKGMVYQKLATILGIIVAIVLI